MRRSGSVRDARDLGRHDHLCWSYEDTPDFLARVREYLAEGLELGKRVRYAALGASPDDLAGITGIETALSTGAAQVTPLSDTYSGEPEEHVRAYAAATEQALADGFTGLRVAAEATPLVSTPAKLTAFLRYEHLVDRYMARRPFSAMCGYDTTVLDEHAVTQLAGVHPCANHPTPFRLHAAPGGEVVELAGEVDAASHDLLGSLLERIDVEGDLVVHAPDLAFIDHRGLLLLADSARRRERSLVLRTRAVGAARLGDLLDMPDVRVEQIP
ncbi:MULTISPECIES: MEDS domain-containing protein [unclassified Saccharothrix]|uniref:MEDS domain-containing protein n=1 Tax=unclassified Saccharothrix TaxID=2593673 RepID=UPI00307ED364